MVSVEVYKISIILVWFFLFPQIFGIPNSYHILNHRPHHLNHLASPLHISYSHRKYPMDSAQ